jgi:catechol 2,3-dioxygenase-like lactoylglutathione lyase family enzyme
MIDNRVLNHIAISVPDLEAAATWYEEVFGFRRIRKDSVTARTQAPDAAIFKIYGQQLKEVKIAYLSTGNSIGFELFQFVDPPYKKPEVDGFDFARGGLFHFAVTVADLDAAAKLIQEKGGKLIGEGVEVYGEHALYAADPWGNVIECLTTSFETLLSNRG